MGLFIYLFIASSFVCFLRGFFCFISLFCIVVVVVVVVSPGPSKGLIRLVALSDVTMIYRHSLGRTGILLPGSLKKLCTGSLCCCQSRMGARWGDRTGEGLGAPQGSPLCLQPPHARCRSRGECAAPFVGWAHTVPAVSVHGGFRV